MNRRVNPRQFWYVVCESKALSARRPVAAEILDEWIVCFRDSDGQPVAFRDRCLHRCGRLSRGSVREGQLTCPYHGWAYDGEGRVVSIPSEGGAEAAAGKQLATHRYATREQHGYVYVRLEDWAGEPDEERSHPFAMPHFGEEGWEHVRLVHDFGNSVTNCVENFIDVPHTAFVHHGIFRRPRGEAIEATVIRRRGSVQVNYENESRNLGSFSWFLNPDDEPVHHVDSFHLPNVTHVVYRVGDGERVSYHITSQSIPCTAVTTRVFTDITYRFGALTRLTRPLARRQAKRVITQDIEELNAQMAVIQKYGDRFIDSPVDRIHKLVSQQRDALDRGEDPWELDDHESRITFWV